MSAAKMFSLFQRVDRAAIRALTTAGAGHVEVHLGVAAVDLHMRFGAGAVHAALSVKVRRQQFDVG